MMRLLVKLACLVAFVVALPVYAQTLPNHVLRSAAPADPADDWVIYGKDVEPILVAEWEIKNERGLRVEHDWGEEGIKKAPDHAVIHEEHQYVFPTGTIRVLDFIKSKGGVLHLITVETDLFVLKGSATVEVAGETVTLEAGDAVHYPSGILRNGDVVEDTTIIVWHVTGLTPALETKAQVIYGREVPLTPAAQWLENSEWIRARTPEEVEKAPEHALRRKTQRYRFDGNSIRVSNSEKGGPTRPVTIGRLDAIIYLTKGHTLFYQGDRVVELRPGDAIREISGEVAYWDRMEPSQFIAISSLPLMLAKESQQ